MGLRRRLPGLVSLARDADLGLTLRQLPESSMSPFDGLYSSNRCDLRGSSAARHHRLTNVGYFSTLALERPLSLHRTSQTHSTWQQTHYRVQVHSAALHRLKWRQTACLASAATQSLGVEGDIIPGSLVFYKRDTRTGICLVTRPDGKHNWLVEDTRRNTFSLRPNEVQYVCARGISTEQDLIRVETEAAEAADYSLLETAWDVVQEEKESYTVSQMAEFLFGAHTPSNAFAVLQMLNKDRLFFKQMGRQPATFQPRPQKEVDQIRKQVAAEQRVREEEVELGQDLKAALSEPIGRKPSPETWLKGRWGAHVRAVEALALGRADVQQRTQAFTTLQAAGMHVGDGDAGLLLQGLGFWDPHDQLELRKAGLTVHFPLHLEEMAAALLARPPPDPDAATRVDLRSQCVLTIDDESTREIDDGLAVERLAGGVHRLWVHVADPTRWLDSASHPLCFEARARTRTLYLPTGAITMFPHSLATGPFSLRQQEDCCALSIGLDVDEEGALQQAVIHPSCIRVSHRLSYDETDALLEEPGSDHPLKSDLELLNEVAVRRRKLRTAAGALTVSLPEADIHVGPTNCEEPNISIRALDQEGSTSRQLVAELMILANEAVGIFGGREEIPLPYRGQAPAVLPSADELRAVPPGFCTMALLRSRMTRGQLHPPAPISHAGLGLSAYVQFTSPIRRFTDMLAHWQIKAHLRGEGVPFSAEQLTALVDECNSRSREHVVLERKVTNYWLTHFFRQHQAAGRSTWSALLLQWVRQDTGFAKVLLEDLGLEVPMHIARPLCVGDLFEVEVTSINLAEGSFRFVDVSAAIESVHVTPGSDAEDEEEGRLSHDVADPADLEPRLLVEQAL